MILLILNAKILLFFELCKYIYKKMDKSLVNEVVASWSRIIAGEIPVAGMIWARSVEAVKGLEYKLYRCLHA